MPPAFDGIADCEAVEITEGADAPRQVALVNPVRLGGRRFRVLNLRREVADEQVIYNAAVEDIAEEIPFSPAEAHLSERAGQLGVVAADVTCEDRAGRNAPLSNERGELTEADGNGRWAGGHCARHASTVA